MDFSCPSCKKRLNIAIKICPASLSNNTYADIRDVVGMCQIVHEDTLPEAR